MSDTVAPEPTPPKPARKATLRFGKYGLNAILVVFILIIALPLLFLGYRVALNFKAKRDITIAENNLHSLYEALYHYSLDWDGKLPPSEEWTDAATGYLPSASGLAGGKQSYLAGPGDGEKVGYIYNESAGGYNIQDEEKIGPDGKKHKIDPHQLILLIEHAGSQSNSHQNMPVQGTSSAADALYKILDFPHFSDDPDNAATVVLYASGAVSVRTRKDFKQP